MRQLGKRTSRLRDRRRYDRFLRVKDVYPDLTFRKFLTTPYFKKLLDT